MRHFTTAACAIAVGATLSGCVSAMTPLDPDIVALVPPQTAGMDALLEGELVIENDCVYIDASGIGPEYDRILPIFPSNTVRWDGDALLIHDAPHSNGDPVRLGGGMIAEPTSTSHLPEEGHIPEGCSTEYVFLVAPQ